MQLRVENTSHETLDLRTAFLQTARHKYGKPWSSLSVHEQLQVVGSVVRNLAVERAIETDERFQQAQAKRAFYLSLEFLLGRLLQNNLVNLGIFQQCEASLQELGTPLGDLLEVEADAALGNGGLGRLAACLLDSLATLNLPGMGYGIHYQYGLFKQVIQNGCQVEQPDNWLKHGTPWELNLTDEAIEVQLYGRVQPALDSAGHYSPQWVDTRTVLGIPHDLPVVGFGGTTVNLLRLFSAHAARDFDLQVFEAGNYVQALHERDLAETISKVLYPNDSVSRGPELRLIQEYFLVACSLRDILRRLDLTDLRSLPTHAAIQLNDTHPALCVPELMRILVDEQKLDWDSAWNITVRTLGYTNHTLMPEALERWPVALVQRVLPRHLEIIYEINRRLEEEIAERHPGDVDRLRRMSLIEETPERRVRMAYLAIVGSHSVNGVAEVHSQLVKTQLVPDFYELTPDKFNNKTNGVTPRRWLNLCNPALAELITEVVGQGWITDLQKLRGLERVAPSGPFQQRFRQIKQANKSRLANLLGSLLGARLDSESLFDVQIKRIHQYKRQLLHVLLIIDEYLDLVAGIRPAVPRTHLFAGKAAPGYHLAKEIIHLINAVAEVVNREPRCQGSLAVHFVPDYRVTLAEQLIPAADLSEQISTAGTEASGTSNMKFGMNGALTIGTLDGANIEMCQEIGAENMFIFGNRVDQIDSLRTQGVHPRQFYDADQRLQRIMNVFKDGLPGSQALSNFSWVYDQLVQQWDPYFHLADLNAYLTTQAEVSQLYQNPTSWTEKTILNVARMGKFSSDRTALQYAEDIWNIHPLQNLNT